MNILFGKISWNHSGNNEIHIDFCDKYKMDNISLCVGRTKVFSQGTKTIFCSDKTQNVCALVGYVHNIQDIKVKHNIDGETDVEIIETLYQRKRLNLASELDGVFTVFIFDAGKHVAYVFQDQYASNIPVYYYHTRKEFVFSTNLKHLLKEYHGKRELNIYAVYDFLQSKITINNKRTLVKNVYKLVPHKCIVIHTNKHRVKIRKIKRPETERILNPSGKLLLKNISDNIKCIYHQVADKNPSMTLSSGFDSNFVLHTLRSLTPSTITAVTIGGKEINEIPVTESIINNNYKNIKHIKGVVENDMLNYLPDIMWKLEGYVFASGIFLQYKLAKLLAEANQPYVFLGECADQQLERQNSAKWNENSLIIWLLSKFFHVGRIAKKTFILFLKHFTIEDRHVHSEYSPSVKQSCNKGKCREYSPKKNIWSKIYHQFYVELRKAGFIGNDYAYLEFILKKNGIMLNSFGVQGLYPYLNNELKATSRALHGQLVKKKLYKKEVKKVLGPNIAEVLDKIGGSTDISYLFTDDKKVLIDKVLDSDFIIGLIEKPLIGTVMKSAGVLEAIQNCEYTDKLKREYVNGNILLLLFLYVFNELFITGKYDSEFDQNEIDVLFENMVI